VIRLNQLGISVVCFEKTRLGGVCLNKGCIPTKALIKTASLYNEMKSASEFGLESFTSQIDYEKISSRKNQIVNKLVSGIEFIFNKRNIDMVNLAVTKIEKNNDTYSIFTEEEKNCTADYIIIATGAEPRELPILPFDGQYILSSDHVLSLTELPKKLVIIGGGVIGCEFAYIFATLGVEVTIIEFLPEIISTEDEEVIKRYAMQLKKLGIKIFTKTKVEAGRIKDESVELILTDEKSTKEIKADKVLVSIGRKPVFNINTKGFAVSFTSDFININDYCQTIEENVFAIGDVTGKFMLAHTASKQGLLVADYLYKVINKFEININTIDYRNIPACIYTNPEVASCGLTEKKASDLYSNIKVGRFPYAANGKAMASGANVGFVKTIINAETDQIVGMHIIGYQATELIAQASIFISQKATVQDVAKIIFAHPTISECIMESVEDTHKMAIHTV
jgi:dihydrolipoamide dehydrogenase